MTYDNTNRGALFANKKKTTQDHPDCTGSLNVEGKDFWFSGWWKQSKAGEKYLSVSIKSKDGAQSARTRQDSSNQTVGASFAPAPDLDDSIPFAPEVR